MEVDIMYCKRCHQILTNDDLICTFCHFDNHEDYIIDKTKELEIISINDKRESKTSIIITSIAILLTCFILSLYIIKDSKTLASSPSTTFTYEALAITYPSTFTRQDNNLLLNENHSVFIEFKIISIDDYQSIIDNNAVTNDKVGQIATLSYQDDTSLNHVFIVKNQYYLISIHYDDSNILDNQRIKKELQSVLNSIREQ